MRKQNPAKVNEIVLFIELEHILLSFCFPYLIFVSVLTTNS